TQKGICQRWLAMFPRPFQGRCSIPQPVSQQRLRSIDVEHPRQQVAEMVDCQRPVIPGRRAAARRSALIPRLLGSGPIEPKHDADTATRCAAEREDSILWRQAGVRGRSLLGGKYAVKDAGGPVGGTDAPALRGDKYHRYFACAGGANDAVCSAPRVEG